jgi:hypothetical protein
VESGPNTQRGGRDAHAQSHTHHDRNGSSVAPEAVEVDDERLDLRPRTPSAGRALAERATAIGTGLAHNVMYMDDLEADVEAARGAYVGLAVTEIATLRGELFGPQIG